MTQPTASTPARAPASARPSRPPERLTRPVVVVNASAVRGLATRTASMLRERGVTVVGVGNLTVGRKPATPTVYYPPGQSGQARALATLSATPTVAPAPQWLQAAGKLVLVVTERSNPS